MPKQDNRRHIVKIISGNSPKKAWYNDMIGQIIMVKFTRWAARDYELFGVTEDYKYIKANHLEILHEYEMNNKKVEDHNVPTCSHFGCQNKLTSYSVLFNDRCPSHQSVPKINIMDVLKLK